jgi:hypothetical protein
MPPQPRLTEVKVKILFVAASQPGLPGGRIRSVLLARDFPVSAFLIIYTVVHIP